MRVNLHRPCFVQLLGTAIVLLLMGTTLLKSQTTTAVISGTVTDTSGAAIPGAKIEVKNVATGISESTTSDNQGRYRVPELLVGDYEVEATQTGFQTVLRKGVTLTGGNAAAID